MKSLFSLIVPFLLLAEQSRAAVPDVDQILRKLIERSEDPVSVSRRNSFAYQRTSRVEYLNEDGTRKRDTVRVFNIFPEDGQPVTRLISVNGTPAKDKEDKNKSAASISTLVAGFEAEGLEPRAALKKAAKILGISRNELYDLFFKK